MKMSQCLAFALLLVLAQLFFQCGSDEKGEDKAVAVKDSGREDPVKKTVKAPKNMDYVEILHPKGKAALAKSRFGAATVAFDFKGAGRKDIAIGAPGEGVVYVLLGPDYKQFKIIAPPDPQPNSGFGMTLAAANLDEAKGDELVVGAPYYNVEKKPRVGKIYVFGKRNVQGVGYTLPEPKANSIFGYCLAVGDVDNDERTELVVGAPRAAVTEVSTGIVYLLDVKSRTMKGVLNNHQKTDMGTFGHDVAVADGNGDGIQDLFVSAVGNTSGDGIAKSGQIVFFPGPVQNGNRVVIENPSRRVGDESRFGMDLCAGDVNGDGNADVLVGSPRSNVQKVKDAGLGFLFWGPDFDPGKASVKARLDPKPTENDILGFRVCMGNVMGDNRVDLILSSLADKRSGHPKALVIWDGSQLNKKPRVLEAMEGASSHYIEGMSVTQLDGQGFEELILGDPRFSSGDKEEVGRVIVAKIK